MSPTHRIALWTTLALLSLGASTSSHAQPAEPTPTTQQVATVENTGPKPFGSSLFSGNFLAQRQDGIYPDYVVMPGDRVAVNTWGNVRLQEVLVVDGQGNIFIPGVGPVALGGVRNADLTSVVHRQIARVYRNVDVYTNLLSAAPVGVFVTGGVVRPGRYAGVPSDSVLFFLNEAGGIEPALGSYRSIHILRDGSEVAELDLYAFLLEGKLPAPQLQEGDTILVDRRGPVVELRGSSAQPALVELRPQGNRGDDVVKVVPNSALVTEVTVAGLREGQHFVKTLPLADFTKFPLKHGDTIEFREDGQAAAILVRLEGEFEGPSVLAVRRGARLLDVLNHVPVKPEIANTKAVHIRRASVARAQKKAIEDSLFRLERSALLALSRSQGEASIRTREAESTRAFVESARLIQPVGRVVTARQGEQQNLMLEEDDVIVIPPHTSVVRVSGEVQLTQAVTYGPDLIASDYIEAAGGYSDRADDDTVIIMHASAEVTVGDGDSPIAPGDELLIPPRIDKKRLQNASDIINVIYQVAVSAGVVLSSSLAIAN